MPPTLPSVSDTGRGIMVTGPVPVQEPTKQAGEISRGFFGSWRGTAVPGQQPCQG
jgi:hypothetical protein